MALFKISQGNSSNLPANYHNGYCYFTIDEGKLYIDFPGTGEDQQVVDGETLIRRPLNANRADFVGYALTLEFDGDAQPSYNGSTSRTYNITPEAINAFDIIDGSTVLGEATFNNVVYLNDETYADSMTIENAIVTGALRVVGDLNGSVINATTFNGDLNGNATSADKLNRWLKIQLNGTDAAQYDGSGDNKTVNVTAAAIGALPYTTLYAGSATQGGPANSAVKLTAGAGDATHPIYIAADGTPTVVSGTQAINVASADKVNHSLRIDLDGTTSVTYDGDTENKSVDITPESINAVRRNGDTIPGPLTLNGVFTVNNDAYIDSATIGDLLVNGGTRFVGDVNAGKITASSFVGPLTGNATSADKVNHYLSIQINGTEKAHYDGSANQSVNLTAESLGLLGATTLYALGDAVGGNAVAANKLTVDAGSATCPVYFSAGVPVAISNTDEIDLIAKQANSVKENLIVEARDTELWRYNGSTSRTLNLTPNLIGAFDIIEGSTVSGESIFNNVVYLNDDTYADSMTIENAIVTGALRVVGDLNGSVINANSFVGALTGNATSADQVNHWLKIQFDGTDQVQYDGSGSNKTVNITPAAIGALSTTTKYAASASVGGSATSAEKLNTNAGDATHPVYFANGVPVQVSGTQAINVSSADKVNHYLVISADGTEQVRFDGSTENKSIDITPELINAVRRNGDTIPGPLTINGVFTVNNDSYIDSATIGDLLVNGGTRFVGDVNAGKITASSFVGPLTGNATSANKVNHWLKIQVNGTDQVQYDGSDSNKTINITPELLGMLANTTKYALGDAVGGNAVKANALNVSAAIGSTVRPVYIQASGVPAVISNTDEIDLIAKKANSLKEELIFLVKDTEKWRYNGSTQRELNLSPALIDAFDIVEGSTVSGEAIFNNVVYLNDETYADSMTIENAIVTGALRVVGDLNGSVINATTFNGTLNGNATSANKVNHSLRIDLDGTTAVTYDGDTTNKDVDITPEAINALRNTTKYAGSDSVGGAATSANKLNTNAGDATHPVYFANGVPVQVTGTQAINVASADKVNHSLAIALDGTNAVTYDGSTSNKSIDITPEGINAVRRNGDTIPGPLTLNGVFTVNNDAYIDSATIGDLLVNGGTRFVGDVNAGKITASSFVGPLTGNATSADKVNHYVSIQINGTEKVHYDGSANQSVNLTPDSLGLLGATTKYALGDAVGGNAVKANALNVSAAIGSTTRPVYIQATGVPAVISNTSEIDLIAKKANSLKESYIYSLRGTEQWRYDGSTQRTLDITPNDMGIFDTIEGSTVQGESVFNNVVYLNDDTYADSMTIENAIVTGALRVVGDLNGSVINATTFNGSLNGNATSADKVNQTLTIELNGTAQPSYDGSIARRIEITPASIGALSETANYAKGASSNGPAVSANKLNTDAGSDTLPVYFLNGVPAAVSTTSTIDIVARQANALGHYVSISADGTEKIHFTGDTNQSFNITPESINAVRRNGDTIPGPLTLNEVFTVNNDAYIDSATVGDLLVNGGTRFVGDINAGKITASSFVGPLTGNALTADEVNHALAIEFNGTNQCSFTGAANATVNITPTAIHAVDDRGDTMTGTLQIDNVNGIKINSHNTDLKVWEVVGNAGSWNSEFGFHELYKGTGSGNNNTLELYAHNQSGSHVKVRTITQDGKVTWHTNQTFANTIIGNIQSADKVNNKLKFDLRGTNVWEYDGSTPQTLDLTPNDLGIFDTLLGSTVQGESVFNNAVYFNDETYADSLTVGNEIITGVLRVVGDLNGSTINATTFNGNLNGNATSADKVNKALTIELNGTEQDPFDGSVAKRINITAANVGAITKLGDTEIGALVFKNDNVGISRVGRSVSWHKGRDSALVKTTSITGYGALASIKTNNGSWDIGAYNNSSFADDLLFTYVTDTQYSGSTAASTAQIKFLENGHIVAALDGNASTADKTNHALTLELDGTAEDPFDGSASDTINIAPETINAVRRNGDTIPGPLTLNGVMTINNDAYIDSATIGDLLVNGGTRFVGDVNADKITASSFVGPLTGNATSADKANIGTCDVGSIAFYGDTNGTFAKDPDFTWDSTNQILTANKLNGYVIAGRKANSTLGTQATAEGIGTTASGSYSHAEGNGTTASGSCSHAEGNSTTASGSHSHAEGSGTKASSNYSHAEGSGTTASGDYSHAEGVGSIASGKASHAEGWYTTAQRRSQHVFGEYNILDTTGSTDTHGDYVEIVGNGTSSNARSNARTLDWMGNEVLSGKLTTKGINNLFVTGIGTANTTANPFKPTFWTFNANFAPVNGDIVTIKIPVTGTSYGTLLSLQNGASNTYHPVVITSYANNLLVNSQYGVNSLVTLIYDATATVAMLPVAGASSVTGTTTYTGVWRTVSNFFSDANTYPSAYCSSLASITTKIASCSSYVLTANSYLHFVIVYSNTIASALTMNVNNTGAKAIYINGQPSSATNYTLPAGSYLAFYDGTNWYFRTDGVLPSNDGFTKKAIVGSKTNNSSTQYYRFARVTATDTTIGANKNYRFRAYYKILGLYPGNNSTNGEFSIDFSITSDANSVATVTYHSLRWTYREWIAASTVSVRVGTTNKELNIYVWSGNSHYVYEIELLRIEDVINTNPIKRSLYAPVLTGTGYSITFLTEVTSPTTTSTPAGTLQTTIENGHIGYANQATRLPAGDTLPSTLTAQENDLFVQTNADKTMISLPSGGVSGQMLYKINDDDGAAGWINPNLYNSAITKVFVTGCVSNTSRQLYNANIYMNMSTGVLMGAAWNDYAEFRQADSLEPGRCVVENGDDTLSLSTDRMQPGAEIISDTYGFAIGETEKSKTPIAATGRVLAYPYEDRNEFKPGRPVCSGPNGTVSIMTDQEAKDYPWCIIGTVSAVPNYEVWGEKEIKVNGRVWIRIK